MSALKEYNNQIRSLQWTLKRGGCVLNWRRECVNAVDGFRSTWNKYWLVRAKERLLCDDWSLSNSLSSLSQSSSMNRENRGLRNWEASTNSVLSWEVSANPVTIAGTRNSSVKRMSANNFRALLDLNCITTGSNVKYKKFLNLFNQFIFNIRFFLEWWLFRLIVRNCDHLRRTCR